MDITQIVPTARPLSLGGEAYLVSELRMADLAELQVWIDARIPSPFDVVAAALAGGGPEVAGWVRLVSGSIDAQSRWPRTPGDPEAEGLLQSEGGRKLLLALVLRRHHPDADADAVYRAATVAEYARLHRVAWGHDPRAALARLVDGPGPEGRGPDWGAAWFRYVTEASGGPPFEQLTISQFVAFRNGGRRPGTVDRSNPHWQAVASKRERFFASLDDPPETPPEEPTRVD